MCEGKNELNEKELIQMEYEEICADWRHRDSMMWQSLAVAITLTGVVFVAAFGKDFDKPWMLRTILFLISSILNFVLILKISKDHYYQLGSSELLSKLENGKLRDIEQINPDKHKDNLRIWRPSNSFFEETKNNCKIPCHSLYGWLIEKSAFKWFFRVQLFLIIINLMSLGISLYNFIGYEFKTLL